MPDVHTVAIKMLQEDPRLHATTLTQLYMQATDVPLEVVPGLIAAFKKAKKGRQLFSLTWYDAAIANLEQQNKAQK